MRFVERKNIYIYFIQSSLTFVSNFNFRVWELKTTVSVTEKTTIFLSLASMMTSWNGAISALLAICAGNSPVPGEFPTQRPVTRNFDVYFDLRPNKRLSKQLWGWWFETQSRSLWRHRNVYGTLCLTIGDNAIPNLMFCDVVNFIANLTPLWDIVSDSAVCNLFDALTHWSLGDLNWNLDK